MTPLIAIAVDGVIKNQLHVISLLVVFKQDREIREICINKIHLSPCLKVKHCAMKVFGTMHV
jgi:hypothetical protein